MLTSRLGDHLCRSEYHSSASGLKDGAKTSAPSAKRAIQTFNKWGKQDRNYKESLIYINRYFNASGSVRGCPICANHRDHSITDCPALKARGLSVTYTPSLNTNPDLYSNNNPSGGNPDRGGPPANNKGTTPQPSPVDIGARLAALEASFSARLAQLESKPTPAPPQSGVDAVSAKKASVGGNTASSDPLNLSDFTDWSEGVSPANGDSGNGVRANRLTVSILSNSSPIVATNPRARSSRINPSMEPRASARVTCYASNQTCIYDPSKNHRLVCLDSGASHDLWNCRDDFLSYSALAGSGKFVTLANESKVPILGVGTIQVRLSGKIIRLNDVFHVPRLDMCLLSIRVHRCRGDGCSFIADSTGCFYTFPTFTIEVDDDTDVTLPFSLCSSSAIPDFCDAHSSTSHLASVAARAAYLSASVYGRRVAAAVQDHRNSLESGDGSVSKPDAQSDTCPLPSRYVPCSGGPKQVTLTNPQLHRYFGNRRLDYNILPHLGTGLQIPTSEDTRLSVGDVVNIKRTRRGNTLRHSPLANHTVGADIGYGDGTSPGGYNYCLFLTCLGTKATFVYGLRDTKGETLCDAFWMYACNTDH